MIVAVFNTHPASESFLVSSRSFLAIMSLKSIVISEILTTWFTFVRWIRREFFFVIKQCLFPGETFFTLSTLEGSFSTVYPQMVLEVRRLSETFFTPSIFEGFFFTVYPQMAFQVRWLSELFFTPSTSEGPFIVMYQQVSFQMWWPSGTLVTLRTFVGFFSIVYPQMDL